MLQTALYLDNSKVMQTLDQYDTTKWKIQGGIKTNVKKSIMEKHQVFYLLFYSTCTWSLKINVI